MACFSVAVKLAPLLRIASKNVCGMGRKRCLSATLAAASTLNAFTLETNVFVLDRSSQRKYSPHNTRDLSFNIKHSILSYVLDNPNVLIINSSSAGKGETLAIPRPADASVVTGILFDS